MYRQTTQHLFSPKIQQILNGELTPHLFARLNPKINNKTQPFVYCGELQFWEYEKDTSKPVHLIYLSLDYDDFTENSNLIDIYLWRPENKGYKTITKISKRLDISEKRKRNYKKPNITERSGLVTSRVGQGYYRQQILDKWGGVCAATKCTIKEILIASHIVCASSK